VSSILTNMFDLMGQRALDQSRRAMNTALERLATGKRINRASDDPAGMVAAGNLSMQAIRAQREMKALEGDNRTLDATEGGLSVVSDLLAELDGLVVSAASTGGLSPKEREALQVQASGILQAIDYVSTSTTYDGKQVITAYASSRIGSGHRAVINPATGSEDTVAYTLADLAQGGALNLVDGDLEAAQKAVRAAVDGVGRDRAQLGATWRSNAARINALAAEFENTMAAKSAIEDTDYAREVSEYVRGQLLGEASIKAILIGRQQQQSILALL
jgi:flagellin